MLTVCSTLMALSQQAICYILLAQPLCAYVDMLSQWGGVIPFSQRLCACFTHIQRSVQIAGILFLTNG